MNTLAQQPTQQTSVTAFWARLGGVLARLLATNAHADIIVTVRDGKVHVVRVDQRYLPTDIPQG